MIRRIVLVSVSVVALSAAANAADMYRAPEGGGYKDAGVPVENWSGFYVGVNGGYGWGTGSKVYDLEENAGNGAVIASASTNFTPAGGFGGGQIGYNWQRDRVVYGLEADIQGADINGSGSAALDATHWAEGSTHLNWFGTVRGRLGLTIFDRGLVYATGGFAYGGIQDKVSKMDGGGFGSLSSSYTATGYVIGAGGEYALSPAWSVKAEYQYIDLGKDSLSVDVALPVKYVGELDAVHAYSTVRAGINYHFAPAYEPLK